MGKKSKRERIDEQRAQIAALTERVARLERHAHSGHELPPDLVRSILDAASQQTFDLLATRFATKVHPITLVPTPDPSPISS